MNLKTFFCAAGIAAAAVFAALPGFAGEIMIRDSYARAASPSAKAGAAFMMIMNQGDGDDRLIEVRTDVARRARLHTHIDAGNGVMQMRHAKDGLVIAAGETLMLARGGNHIMLMGLTQSFTHGDMIEMTLVFENAGEMTVEIPIDLERSAEAAPMSHGVENN